MQVTSAITAVNSFKDPEDGFKDLKGCFLYVEVDVKNNFFIPTNTSSVGCSAIKTYILKSLIFYRISSIEAVSSLIVLCILTWIAFTNIKRSAPIFWILLGFGVVCSCIGFLGSCLYSVGLQKTKENLHGNFDQLIGSVVGGHSTPISNGEKTSWLACLCWIVFSALEFISYKWDQTSNKTAGL